MQIELSRSGRQSQKVFDRFSLNARLLHPACVALLLSVAMTSAARAQAVNVVTAADSALLIVTPATCATACPDSVRIEWRYGGQYVTRKIRRTAVDTARVERIPSNSDFSDTARLVVTPLPPGRNAVNIAAFVAPIVVANTATTAAPTAATNDAARQPVSTGGAAASTSTGAQPPAPETAPSAAVPAYVSTTIVGSFVSPTAPATFSVAYPTMSGKIRRVTASHDLQATLNAVQPGEEIVLANGATFTGNFVLPAKTGAGWIVIRGEAPLGAQGIRIDPKQLAGTAIVATNNSEPAIRTAPGATHWRLVGFQIQHNAGAAYNYGIVVLGRGDERSLALLPTDIVLDRMYVHGSITDGNSRCLAFNGIRLAVVQSWITECHAKGADAQGVGGWGGPGPFLIENNRIEGSGQGVMFGGADPSIDNVSPSDIVIRRNYFYKPLSWGRGRWTVKAAFELKHARRVLFEGNVIENHWADAQTGFALLFQTLANNNRAWAWTTVQDVMVQNNIIRNSTSGVNVLSRVAYNGGILPSNPTSRVAIVNNLFENVGRDPIANTSGIALQLLSDLVDVTFAQNTTTIASGRLQKMISFDAKPEKRTTISDNIFPPADYPMTGNSTGAGTQTLNAFMPGGIFRSNAMPGALPKDYPAGALSPSARGANMALIRTATAGVEK